MTIDDAIDRTCRGVTLSLLALLVASAAAPAIATAPFSRDAFNKIQFSGECNQKQWSLTEDNALEVILAPSRKGYCMATLEFYFPKAVSAYSSVSFEAKASEAGPYLKLGLQQKPGTEPQYTRRFPRAGLGKTWKTLTLEWNDIRKDWDPKEVAVIHLVAIPNHDTRFGETANVFIRGIHWSGTHAAAVSEPTVSQPVMRATPVALPAPVRALPTPLVAARVPPARMEDRTWESVVGNVPQAISRLPLNRILLTVLAFGVFGLARQKRSRPHRNLSPLYEMNTRTWKTRRDANGVIELGGFKRITLSDLKGIKHEGFNALWLMGIWEVGPKVRDISKNYAQDYRGSPFAILDYRVSSDLGSEEEFRELVQRAHSQRLSVIVDFVPNHMGLDSLWLNDHPEFFIHHVLDDSETTLPDPILMQRYPGYFPYRTPAYPQGDHRVPKTIMVAYGRDPYFYPWIDTAQLDYANPGLRRRMIEVLTSLARVVDGVRCDMAMLVLRDQVKNHRHPEMSWDAFNQLMPGEFWSEAIQAVKRVNPNFTFIAETYWSMEGALQNLGFDYTYNKPLYEAICGAVHSGHAEGLMNFLRLLGTDFLSKGVHFLENHDEERALNTLGEERQIPAAAILSTLPGIALIHQGQMEGRRERLPVQRVIPLHQESPNNHLLHFYRKLLNATALPVFQHGRLTILYSNNPSLVSYARIHDDAKALVIVNTSNRVQKGSVFFIPGLRLASGSQIRLNDLFFDFKSPAARKEPSVQPHYVYPAAQLLNHGLYVELQPFDAHLFILEPVGASQAAKRAFAHLRPVLENWSLNRLSRRMAGMAFSRSSDANLAANPAGRHQ